MGPKSGFRSPPERNLRKRLGWAQPRECALVLWFFLVVKQQGLQEDALLKDVPEAGCKVVTIWEACRATSAATSFFDPIAVGRFGEEFVDGATGALSLKPFKDDVLHIGETLVAIATETEQTAERFRREKALLDSTGRYYRFNVVRGLEDIRLEEAKKVKEMAAATRWYIRSQKVYKQMQSMCWQHRRESIFGEYHTMFSLEGVPRVSQFVDRPAKDERKVPIELALSFANTAVPPCICRTFEIDPLKLGRFMELNPYWL
ncbi:hypothetical protein GQ44DRAFT_832012 [Phaeosphaeriaceae sp. PMI808]|nr:hypothetical protein GQ44DRAFT_832012 [Phaeosphaeriaceae sp. PMI808]